jgi:hypothetical protein
LCDATSGFQRVNAIPERVETVNLESAVGFEALLVGLYDPALVEQGHVSGGGGLIDTSEAGEFGDTHVALGEGVDDEKPGWMTEGFADLGARFISGCVTVGVWE